MDAARKQNRRNLNSPWCRGSSEDTPPQRVQSSPSYSHGGDNALVQRLVALTHVRVHEYQAPGKHLGDAVVEYLRVAQTKKSSTRIGHTKKSGGGAESSQSPGPKETRARNWHNLLAEQKSKQTCGSPGN